jgi:hypothetical protein
MPGKVTITVTGTREIEAALKELGAQAANRAAGLGVRRLTASAALLSLVWLLGVFAIRPKRLEGFLGLSTKLASSIDEALRLFTDRCRLGTSLRPTFFSTGTV